MGLIFQCSTYQSLLHDPDQSHTSNDVAPVTASEYEETTHKEVSHFELVPMTGGIAGFEVDGQSGEKGFDLAAH